MTTWAHVTGCIKFSSIRMADGVSRRADFENALIANNCGLDYALWENPDNHDSLAYVLSIFGDIKDFGVERLDEIFIWIRQVLKLKDVWQKEGVLRIIIEEDGELVLSKVYDIDPPEGGWYFSKDNDNEKNAT